MTEPSSAGAHLAALQRARRDSTAPPQPANLADILERVLDKGIIIAGDIRVNLLDIELLTIKIRLLIVSVDKAQEMGIDWWRNDPMLTTPARRTWPTRTAACRPGSRSWRRGPPGARRAGRGAAGHARWLSAAATSTPITRGLDRRRRSRTSPALDGGRLDVVEHRGLAAVVSDVDLDGVRRGGAAPQPRGPDLARGGRPRATTTSCTRSPQHGPTAPLRLATICLDDDGVRSRLDGVARRASGRPWTGSRGARSGA